MISSFVGASHQVKLKIEIVSERSPSVSQLDESEHQFCPPVCQNETKVQLGVPTHFDLQSSSPADVLAAIAEVQ